MNSQEISHYKAVLYEAVGKIQEQRRKRVEIDGHIAALFKEIRAQGLSRKIVRSPGGIARRTRDR